MRIEFTANIFREGDQFVSHAPELDVSSCGATYNEARRNLDEAVQLFLEDSALSGTLASILEECGYTRSGDSWRAPQLVAAEPGAEGSHIILKSYSQRRVGPDRAASHRPLAVPILRLS